MRQHRGEPRPRAEHHPVRLQDRRDRLGHGRRVGGQQRDGPDPARRDRDCRLAAHGGDGVGLGRVEALHGGDDVHRHRGHRQHPPGDAQQPAHPVEAGDRVAEQVPQARDQQVAQGVAGQVAAAAEAMLDHAGPGRAPFVVPAQRREGHPQVPRGQRAELLAEPARRAAVVGHGDDRGHVVGHPAQRGQGRGEAVPPAERDHPRSTLQGGQTLTPARGRGATR
jgi:hypothetical protein